MTLADALTAHKVAYKGPKCSMCRLVGDLPKADRDALLSALADPTFTHAAIARALHAEGFKIAALTVGRHRKGECQG